jgi:hypothetical protein
MRTSRVLLAGVAVAGAAVTTSAFTASNTLPATTVAGFGEVAVTGATVTDIHYVVDTADGTIVDAIEFTSTTDLTTKTSTLTLKDGGVVVGTPYPCTVKTAWDTTDIEMTCDTSGSTRNFEDFDSLGITVVD